MYEKQFAWKVGLDSFIPRTKKTQEPLITAHKSLKQLGVYTVFTY